MAEKMQGFADTALKAMPKWAWGALGTFIGVVLTLQFTGYNASLNRVIEAHVKRIEASVSSIDDSGKRLANLITAIEQHDKSIQVLTARVDKIEAKQTATDEKYHKQGIK